jgi:hypothetical protein
MAQVQKHFDCFHDNIKLRRFKRNATLREKRDIILAKLKRELPKVFKRHGDEMPEYDIKDLGSYAMGTGNKPVDEDYDIDQGIFFRISTNAFDPVVLKQRVHEAIDGHTDEIEIRRPCVTVWYQRDGEPVYHVDLAIFADGGWIGEPYLAKGRENSGERYRIWERSDPVGLIEKIYGRFEGVDRAQFRRIVRYLKRWRDENFTPRGNESPISVGLTVAAYHWMQNFYFDGAKTKPDDLSALLHLARQMLNNFSGLFSHRLKVELPVQPRNDLFSKMTDNHQKQLEKKLEELRDALKGAQESVDPHEACMVLTKVLGNDFPVPAKEETAKKQGKPYASSSSAA